MTNFDVLFLCCDNNAKSRSGLVTLNQAGYSLLVLVYEIPRLRLDPKRPREIYTKPRWYRRHWLKNQSASIYCHEHGIPYFIVHETDMQVLLPPLRSMQFDYVIVNGWPAKLPSGVGALATKAAMNFHSSYLPEYRGGNITYAPLINGEKTSGITAHILTEQLDAGPIIAQKRFYIESRETVRSLTLKRSVHIGDVLLEAIRNMEQSVPSTENPPSVFWKRQSYVSYLLYRGLNALRRILGLRILRREAGPVRLIDKI